MVVGEDSEVNLSSIHLPSGSIEPWDLPQVLTPTLKAIRFLELW